MLNQHKLALEADMIHTSSETGLTAPITEDFKLAEGEAFVQVTTDE